ncbi:MAG TPA: hypothetical protein VHE30_05385 [Polyangiaceae bacterium]|nr:hypothetical protein [Polyangiaceae bacterium]
MRRLVVSTLLLAPVVAAACSTSTLATAIVPITSVEVHPEAFLGDLTCSLGGAGDTGSVHLYVATLTDVSRFDVPGYPTPRGLQTSRTACYPAKACFALPSSAPARCDQTVSFQRVVSGRQYVVDVDAYDRDDLHALAPGSRILVDETGAVVPPRWQSSCGRRLGPDDPGPGNTYPGLPAAPDPSVPDGDASPSVSDAGSSSSDGAAAPTDAGLARADASIRDASAPVIPVLPEKPDSGFWYYECRAPEYPDGTPAWLGGPTCVLAYDTVRVQTCEPLASSGGN